jgi:hypothetical protein
VLHDVLGHLIETDANRGLRHFIGLASLGQCLGQRLCGLPVVVIPSKVLYRSEADRLFALEGLWDLRLEEELRKVHAL